ncbi:transcriptional regulator [Desmospora sp. 8437]|nr:transcriptional regulator [Desmospora sp. 8437]
MVHFSGLPEITQATGGSACGKSNALRRAECQDWLNRLTEFFESGEVFQHVPKASTKK